ncbi:unnamed protein product, partial [Ixodes pacificus]
TACAIEQWDARCFGTVVNASSLASSGRCDDSSQWSASAPKAALVHARFGARALRVLVDWIAHFHRRFPLL